MMLGCLLAKISLLLLPSSRIFRNEYRRKVGLFPGQSRLRLSKLQQRFARDLRATYMAPSVDTVFLDATTVCAHEVVF